jgi:hypothetical protein
MSNRLDDRIRELLEELDRAAPEAPPAPVAERAPAAPWWQRRLVPAAGLVVAVLVLGVASQLFVGNSDSAEEATDTTEAAAEGGDGPADTRPPDFALVLTDLNLACVGFVHSSAEAVPAAPDSDREHLEALKSLVDPTSDLEADISTVADINVDEELDGLSAEAGRLLSSVETAAAGTGEAAPAAYDELVEDVGALGSGLEGYGALECSALDGALP